MKFVLSDSCNQPRRLLRAWIEALCLGHMLKSKWWGKSLPFETLSRCLERKQISSTGSSHWNSSVKYFLESISCMLFLIDDAVELCGQRSFLGEYHRITYSQFFWKNRPSVQENMQGMNSENKSSLFEGLHHIQHTVIFLFGHGGNNKTSRWKWKSFLFKDILM